MQPVIYPIEKKKLIAELTEEHFMRKTNKGGNEIYTFDAHSAPNLMQEVGRIRELTFRSAGGGTGKETDIDEFVSIHKLLISTDRLGSPGTGNYRRLPLYSL